MEYSKEHVESIKQHVSKDADVLVIDPTEENIKNHLPSADVLIMSPLDHINLIDFSKAKNLKWVHQTAAGTAPLIQKLIGTNIILTNSSGVHPIPIAEQVFTYILMFARQFHLSFRRQVEERQWIQDDIDGGLRELNQSNLGIVGFGKIGKRVAHLAKSFGMSVFTLQSNNHPNSDENVDIYFPRDGVNEMLEKSDFVVNCLPATAQTDNYFNKDRFAVMKNSAYFINIGRGSTVNEQELIMALKEGKIAGAGLDVFSSEPLPDSSELWQLKNVILTPHYAGWTPRYIDRVIDIFCENLQAYLNHKSMPNYIDLEKGY